MENTFEADEKVVAKINPEEVLVVRRYLNRIYYCRVSGSADINDKVFYERELDRYFEVKSKTKIQE